MLKISRLADYAILIMMSFEAKELQSGTVIAEKTDLGQATVGKILKRLAEANLLNSQKGASGGYSLARSVAEISLSDVITAIDGPVALTDCNNDLKPCAQAESCQVKGNWNIINDVVAETLKALSLKDMAKPLSGLQVELKPVIKLNVKHE